MLSTLKRFWPTNLLAMGSFLVVGGFIYDTIFAGIPYQDPTPAMSANYARHSHVASTIRWCGGVALLLGAFIACGRWVVRRQKNYQNEKQIR